MYILQIIKNWNVFFESYSYYKHCYVWNMLKNRKKISNILDLKFSCLFIQLKTLNFTFIHSFEKYMPH